MDPLVLLALSHAPEIGKWVLGSTDGKIAAAVAELVRAVTGSSEAADAQQVIVHDFARATQLRLALAKLAAQQEQILHQADFDELKKQIADVAGAKAQGGDFAKGGSGAVWGGAAVSIVVLLTFGMVMWTILTHAMPAGSEGVLNVLLGMLGTGFAAVTNYWLGSSAGSLQKTTLLALSSPPGAGSPRGDRP